jgi:molybdopterin-guanine dinucleotide biosynthesis protein A
MGRDKALLRVGGVTLLERAVAAVRQAGGEPLIVAPERPGYGAAGVRSVDERAGGDGEGEGPLPALRHGLMVCGAPGLVALACDLPLVPPDLLRRLIADLEGSDAVVPRAGGRLQVLAAAYGTGCLPAIDRSLAAGRRSVHGFLKEVRVRYLEEDELRRFGSEIFLNVNTPADARRVEAILAREGR